MPEIEVRVVSLEEAEHGTAEFWLGGEAKRLLESY